MKILLVAVGSGLGGVLRYLVPCWIGAAKGCPQAASVASVPTRAGIGGLINETELCGLTAHS